MKIRIGFVSNSSSSSFVLSVPKTNSNKITVVTKNVIHGDLITNVDELLDYEENSWFVDGLFYNDYYAETFDKYLDALNSGRNILVIDVAHNDSTLLEILDSENVYKENNIVLLEKRYG